MSSTCSMTTRCMSMRRNDTGCRHAYVDARKGWYERRNAEKAWIVDSIACIQYVCVCVCVCARACVCASSVAIYIPGNVFKQFYVPSENQDTKRHTTPTNQTSEKEFCTRAHLHKHQLQNGTLSNTCTKLINQGGEIARSK